MCLVYMPNGHDLESFLCSLAAAADYSEASCLAGEPSAMSNSTSTVSKYCSNESQTDCLTMHQSLETCENSLVTDGQQNTEDMLTLCRADSRANHSPLLGSSWARTILETCGPQLSLSSMQFDHASASLKTLQLCLIQDTSELSSEIWPKAGIVSDGEFFPQPSWTRRISEIGCGLWPTPANQDPGWSIGGQVEIVDKNGNLPTHHNQRFYDKNTGRVVQKGLSQVVQMWPTPTTRDWRSGAASEDTHAKNSRPLNKVVVREEKRMQWPTPTTITDSGGAALCKWGGSGARQMMRNNGVSEQELNGALNPDWVEWLIGWPVGWTSLEPLPQSAVDDWLSETVNREWWQHEHDLPRVAKGVPNRTHRLKAIGNGQVSVVAAMAWMILTKDLDV